MIAVNDDGPVRVITINAPDRKNALSFDDLGDLKFAVSKTSRTAETKLLVITGEGDHFCAGFDLNEMRAAVTKPTASRFGRDLQSEGNEIVDSLADSSVVSIAIMNGPALGGGAEIACACDLRIANPNTYFEFRHASLGLVPAWGTLDRLKSLCGEGHAARMLLLAARVEAQEALAMGLVAQIWNGTAMAWIQSRAPLFKSMNALRVTKTLLRKNDPMAEHEAFLELFGSPEHRATMATLKK